MPLYNLLVFPISTNATQTALTFPQARFEVDESRIVLIDDPDGILRPGAKAGSRVTIGDDDQGPIADVRYIVGTKPPTATCGASSSPASSATT